MTQGEIDRRTAVLKVLDKLCGSLFVNRLNAVWAPIYTKAGYNNEVALGEVMILLQEVLDEP